MTSEVRIPDLGGAKGVQVIEVLVQVGETVTKDQPLITLEGDKATMEVPAPAAGVIRELKVSVGAKVNEGDLIAALETSSPSAAADVPALAPAAAPAAAPTSAPALAAAAVPAPAAAALKPATASSPPTQASAPSAAAQDDAPVDVSIDIVVIGAGPGGYTAAFRAADLGKKVLLIERYPSLGGVCLNVGCIPSKAMLHAGRVLDEAVHVEHMGISFGKPKIDLDKLRGYKDSVVGKLTQGLAGMSKARGVTRMTGSAAFTSAHVLAVETSEGSKRVRFEHAIIAAGSQPIKLSGLPWGDERLMDSTDALLLKDIPQALLVVGGGIIGLEMASVYAALGARVTVVELLDQLMPGADPDLVKPLHQRIAKRYGAIMLNTKVTKVEAEKQGLRAFFEGAGAPESGLFDRVLVAVGRSPNGRKINAEAAGVQVSERGFIAVDKQMRTNVPHIFAVGDLVGNPMLAHKATHEGKVAAEVAAGHKTEFVARVIPSVAYTDPEVAWVGLTELEAKKQGIAYGKGQFPFAASGRAIGIDRTEGFTKLLFDPETHRVLGGGIVGPNAGDLIAEVGLAIEMGCDAADIGLTIHPHPTLSESIGMAAEVFEGTCTDLYIPKKK